MPVKGARVGVLGLTFKENVPDLRNSRVPDIVRELRAVRHRAARPRPASATRGGASTSTASTLVPLEELTDLDALVLAVAHDDYVACGTAGLLERLRPRGVLVDVKSVVPLAESSPAGVTHWSL